MELIVRQLKHIHTLMHATFKINANAVPVYTDDW